MIYDIYQFSLYWISLTCFTNKYPKSRARQPPHQWRVSLLGLLLKIVHYDDVVWHIFFLFDFVSLPAGVFSELRRNLHPASFLSRVSIKRVSEAVWVESGRKTSIILCFIFASFDKRESSIIFKVLRFWSYTLRPFVLDSTVSVRVQCMTIWHALVGQLRNRKNCHSHVNTSRQLKEEIGIHCLGWRKQ